MTKRARIAAEEVILHYADSDEDYGDYMDDLDEPIMDGSDKEFSDLDGNKLDDEAQGRL